MTDFKPGDRVCALSDTKTEGTVILAPPSPDFIAIKWDTGFENYRVHKREVRRVIPDVLTIPRAELPEVVERDGALWAIGLQYGLGFPAAKHRKRALAQLAVSEFLAAREKAEQDAADQHAAILSKRRDELAVELFDLPVYELHPGPFTYFDSTEVVRAAIDRIIQLEGQVNK